MVTTSVLFVWQMVLRLLGLTFGSRASHPSPGVRSQRARARRGRPMAPGACGMTKEMIVSATDRETAVAILEDDQVVEFFMERERQQGVVGNVYKGRVSKVLPGMQSSFIDLGLERDGFLYVSDVITPGRGPRRRPRRALDPCRRCSRRTRRAGRRRRRRRDEAGTPTAGDGAGSRRPATAGGDGRAEGGDRRQRAGARRPAATSRTC